MKVALTFTAIDAASGYIAGLERRIDSLGDAGEKMRQKFDAMKSHFAEGLKGFGVAYTSMQFMRPGVQAAAALESAGIGLQNSLAAGGRNAAEMAAHFKSMRSTALYLSTRSPFLAPDLMKAQKLLLDSGFAPGDISGGSGLTSKVAGLSQISGQSMEAVRDMAEIFNQQFGAGVEGIGGAFDWIAQSGMEDKLPDLAVGLASMGTRAAAMNIPMKDAITTIGMLEHVARRSGPAIGAFLKSTRPDATSSQAVRMRDNGLNFYDGKGKFIGLQAAQTLLKEKFGGIQGDRMKMLEEIFGEGAMAAEGLIKGEDLAKVTARNERSLKLTEKVERQNQALAQSYDQLVKAGTNAMGSLFAPMTGMLASGARGARNVLGGLGRFSEENPGVSKRLMLLAGGAAAGTLAYTALHWTKAFTSLKGVTSGLASTGAGIVAGKAAEMAGVTPVFVTNWKDSGGGIAAAAGAAVAGSVGGTAAAAAAAKVATGLIPFMLSGALVAGAGLIGWEIGRGINALFSKIGNDTGFRPFDAMGDKLSAWNERRHSDAIARQTVESQVNENKVVINLSVDKDGRVVASGDMSTDFEVNSMSSSARGRFHGN